MFIRSLINFEITAAFIAAAYAQDPAVVNSKTIQVKFENDRVRVLEATLPPSTVEITRRSEAAAAKEQRA